MSNVELAAQELAESLVATAPLLPRLLIIAAIVIPVGIFILGYMIIKDRQQRFALRGVSE